MQTKDDQNKSLNNGRYFTENFLYKKTHKKKGH